MSLKIKPNHDAISHSKPIKIQQSAWQAKITNPPTKPKTKPLTENKTIQLAARSSQQTAYVPSLKTSRKSYAQRQQDNMNEGLLYGAGAYAGLFGACIVASGAVVSAPITVPAAIAGVGLISAANALRKAYDITQEK